MIRDADAKHRVVARTDNLSSPPEHQHTAGGQHDVEGAPLGPERAPGIANVPLCVPKT